MKPRGEVLASRHRVERSYVLDEVQETNGGKTRTRVVVGRRDCGFEVVVDVEALVTMLGSKAAFNKRGVSKLQGGAVEVRRVYFVDARKP